MLKECASCILLACSWSVLDGQPSPPDVPTTNVVPPPESKRLLGIIPNYRSSPSLQNYEPLSPGEKFKIASEDAFDRGTVILAGIFGAEAQATNANRSFGQGAAGFGRYFGAAYGDLVIGDYMTEGVFPTLLHQDPRYFRKGQGSGWSGRLRYAAGQIFWTATPIPVAPNSITPRSSVTPRPLPSPMLTMPTIALRTMPPPSSECKSESIWLPTSSRNSGRICNVNSTGARNKPGS